jgi:hypothetical protein
MTTIDLELAKELQSVCNEKGIKMPNSEDVWAKKRYHTSPYIIYGEEGVYPKCLIHTTDAYAILAPAYTLDEILEWLPKYIQIDDDDENDFDVYYRGLNWSIDPDGWIAEYQAYMYHSKSYCAEFDPNPANAACKLLIYLIKEGLYDTRRD